MSQTQKQRALQRSKDVLVGTELEIGQRGSLHLREGAHGHNERKPAPGGGTLTRQLCMVGMIEAATWAQKEWMAGRLMQRAVYWKGGGGGGS